ncbi:MAG: recombinase family protein [Kiritimatiellae bacterium]|nr:recombinase family protein [Kiritimatiellia bacterium]
MKVYGYARVSTTEQNPERQLISLRAEGVTEILVDKASGANFLRPNYQALRAKLSKGDLLVVQSLDRFGRNYDEIIDEWRYLVKTVGVDVKVLDMPLLDTRQGKGLVGRFVGDIVLQILSFVAETERRKIKERQAQGIAAAKARGVKFGRPRKPRPTIATDVEQLYRDGEITLREAATRTGMSRSSFFRAVGRLGIGHRKGGRRPMQSVDGRPSADGRPSVEWVMSLPPGERWQYAQHWTPGERKMAMEIDKRRNQL